MNKAVQDFERRCCNFWTWHAFLVYVHKGDAVNGLCIDDVGFPRFAVICLMLMIQVMILVYRTIAILKRQQAWMLYQKLLNSRYGKRSICECQLQLLSFNPVKQGHIIYERIRFKM
jgi:hypothetical protein